MLTEGGKKLELMASDIHDWKITFVETGLQSNIGQRLKAVERVVGDEPEFLANYSDGLSNLSLPDHLAHFRSRDAVASFVSVKPNLSYHLVASEEGRVTAIQDIRQTPVINGGFFCFKREIFDHIRAASSSRSSAWSACVSWPHTSSTVGRRWTRSRIGSSSRKSTHAAMPPGPSGTMAVRRSLARALKSSPDR